MKYVKKKGSIFVMRRLRGGMSPSAIYDLVKGRTKCSKVITVKRFCEGAGVTLKEFFDRDYFNEIEELVKMYCDKKEANIELILASFMLNGYTIRRT